MVQVTFSVRMNEQLKNEFSNMCDKFGISMTTAINIFAKAVVREKRIPFEITAEPREDSLESFLKIRELMKSKFSEDLPIDEIDAEISRARNHKK